jgi:hypothetical protein
MERNNLNRGHNTLFAFVGILALIMVGLIIISQIWHLP